MPASEAMHAPARAIRPAQVLMVGRIMSKRCSDCGVTKELERFHRDRNKPGGVMNYCIECCKKNRPYRPKQKPEGDNSNGK